jgi:RNA polymerase sigma-70 factor (ECF subfamily)
MTNSAELDFPNALLPTWETEDLAPAWLRNVFARRRRLGLECAQTAAGVTMTDAQEFELFMRNYQNMVFSAAMRLLANQAEAEDVTQEVFLKAYERFAELRNSPRVGGWLRTVAVNLSLNHLSRYRSRWTFFSELFRGEESDSAPEPELAASADVGEEAAVASRRELVEDALRQLPASQRVPLALFHMEGLRYEEIALKLGVSLGKVKTDIFRGREAMRKKLEPRLKEDLGLTQ